MRGEASKRAKESHAAGMTLSQAGDEDAAVEQYSTALVCRGAPRMPLALAGILS